jgi:transmembrane sensor
MSPVYNIPDKDDIEAEASAWVVQVDSGAMSKGDIEDLKEWISRSPHHKHSFQKMASGFLDIGTLLARADTTKNTHKPKSKVSFFSAPVMVSMAATLVAGFFFFTSQGPEQPLRVAEPAVQYVASLGEQKELTLPDGSIVTLNTSSKIDVNFTDSERSINLVYGEALFDVAKDTSRPFVVETRQGAVRAVGTVFSVRLIDREVAVLVEEGIVELMALPNINKVAASSSPKDMVVLARLTTGEEASFDGVSKNIKSVELKDVTNRHAWKNGMLIFEGNSLSQVVDEITRYTDMKIVISDPEMQDLQIGGTFKVGETDAFLDAMTLGFNLDVQRVSGNTVYLSQQN